MTRLSLIALLAIAAFGCTSTAPKPEARTTTAAATKQEAAKEEKDDDIICRKEYPLGSNIPKRVCRSRAQVEAEMEANQNAMQKSQNKGRPCGESGC